MTWEQEIKFQAKRAYKEGLEEKASETARNLLEMSLEPEKIAKATGLPLEKVLELQKQPQTVKSHF